MAFNLNIFEILGVLLFLIVVLVLSADSLKGKTGSKFNGNKISRFGAVINSDGVTLNLLDASLKNGPDITIGYTTPQYYLSIPVSGPTALYTENQPTITDGGFQGFYSKPLILLMEAVGYTSGSAPPVPPTDTTAYPSKPTASFLLDSAKNYISLTELFGANPAHPMTLITAGGKSTTPNYTTQDVEYIIPGNTANITSSLTVGKYYYVALGLMSTISPLNATTSNPYYKSPIIYRYGNFVYKSVYFDGNRLIEVDPDGIASYDKLDFGTLYV